ncbi:hypothetical protein EW146_g753 [Bondarzewia mesenterica]|uniref:Uncharacterized protein n=1 Tax=Bondarzewia mesenterica TaxID=1095465 RepID=A0A4S4M7U3_9AGAM|nr:hypothetical protein EW146_g753 [Bondarzewia mesenterica]
MSRRPPGSALRGIRTDEMNGWVRALPPSPSSLPCLLKHPRCGSWPWLGTLTRCATPFDGERRKWECTTRIRATAVAKSQPARVLADTDTAGEPVSSRMFMVVPRRGRPLRSFEKILIAAPRQIQCLDAVLSYPHTHLKAQTQALTPLSQSFPIHASFIPNPSIHSTHRQNAPPRRNLAPVADTHPNVNVCVQRQTEDAPLDSPSLISLRAREAKKVTLIMVRHFARPAKRLDFSCLTGFPNPRFKTREFTSTWRDVVGGFTSNPLSHREDELDSTPESTSQEREEKKRPGRYAYA